MVRKDVKIGAVVLAILIAVIVVYVLVVPSHQPTPQPVAAGDDAFKRQMIEKESTLAEPPKQAVASNEPAVVNPQMRFAEPSPAEKVDPFADGWVMALNTGTLAPRTQSRGNVIDPIRTDSITRQRAQETPAVGNSPIALEAPSTRPAGTAISPASRTYTVKSGDSLARIAESVYGSQVYYKSILEANPTVNPMKLRPGMVLKLPDVKETRGRGGHDDAELPPPSVDSAAEYRVVAGDSLNKIAIKLYGKADRWEEIYELNKTKIGANPARLKVGMILKIPATPTR